MKRSAVVALAISLSIGGALAQTASPGPGSAAPGANTGRPTSGTMTGSSNPAVNTRGNARSDVNATGKAEILQLSALENGRNSFTRGQARKRLEGAGFSKVTGLKKDSQGIWRGKAMRDGQPVTIGFDYKGNIGAE